VLDWLSAPISGATSHEIAPWAVWHARLMVLAWAVLLPAGALAARFFKVTPGRDWPRELDNRTWWHAHRWLQWGGVVVMTVALGLVFSKGARGTDVSAVHAVLGWLVAVAGWLQIAGGMARGSKGGPTDAALRGDHYDMTPRRVAFERIHKTLGWAALLGAGVAIGLGLVAADAPRWMALAIAAWGCVLGAAFVLWQRQGRCIDTYQAIWGPEPRHPGNRRAPIGWGVRRIGSEEP
jgi:hypothetical protein